MKIKCPDCSHKFTPSEDKIILDYDIGYDNDSQFIWEKLPILNSVWAVKTPMHHHLQKRNDYERCNILRTLHIGNCIPWNLLPSPENSHEKINE